MTGIRLDDQNIHLRMYYFQCVKKTDRFYLIIHFRKLFFGFSLSIIYCNLFCWDYDIFYVIIGDLYKKKIRFILKINEKNKKEVNL